MTCGPGTEQCRVLQLGASLVFHCDAVNADVLDADLLDTELPNDFLDCGTAQPKATPDIRERDAHFPKLHDLLFFCGRNLKGASSHVANRTPMTSEFRSL